ncbi:MAG: hypothetical protein CSA62_11625 [Planctomycetota bacterium]|nr:MAG: hypothetical protein CSA62_11625 [Planctomycetota bacterium]
MSLRSLPLLLLAVLVLGVAYYWADQQEQDGPGELPPTVSPLLAKLPGPPDFLQIWNEDGSKEYHFKSAARGWVLSYPVEDEASMALLNNLLGSLASAKKQFVSPKAELTPKMLNETGLDTPLGKIVVGAAAERTTILLGGEDVFRGGIPQSFALIDGDLYKVPSGLEVGVNHNLHEVRNRLVFHASAPGLRELLLKRIEGPEAKQSIKLVRKGDGRLEIVEPIQAPGDSARLSAVLSGLLSIRAERFLPITGTPEWIIDSPPWLEIQLLGNYGRERVRIWRQAGLGCYALVDGRKVVLVLDMESFARVVLASAEELVDRTLWAFDPKKTQRLQLVIKGEGKSGVPMVLDSLHPEPGFRLVQPREGWSESASVARLFDALATMRVQRVLVGEQAKPALKVLSVPSLVVQLSPPVGQRGEITEIRFAQDKGQWLAQPEDADYCVVLDKVNKQALFAPWQEYVERVAFRVDRGEQPNRVVLSEGKQDFVYEKNAEGRWEHHGKPARDFEERLWDRLQLLKAERVLASPRPAELVAERLQRTITVQWLRAPGAKPKTLGVLRLYQGEKGRLWSHRPGDQLVFELWEGFTKDLLVR